jgi:hypothetical protein
MIGVIIRLLTGISHQKTQVSFPSHKLYWFLDRYSPLWLIEMMPYNNQEGYVLLAQLEHRGMTVDDSFGCFSTVNLMP